MQLVMFYMLLFLYPFLKEVVVWITLYETKVVYKCDMYKSWQMINEIRDLRKQRRDIKDEKLVLSGIKSQGISYLSRNSVQKCVDGLSKRKYRIRIVEEDEEV